MSLQASAEARKARLQALRARREGKAVDGQPADNAPIVFRSYDRETGQARKHARADGEAEETVESRVAGLAERIVAEDADRRAQELDLLNIQPKKANADLRRDLDRKLDKLRPQTERAIATLIRRRLAASKAVDGQESAEGVALAAAVERRTIDDEAGQLGSDDED